MSTEQTKELAHRLVKLFSGGDLSLISNYFSPEFIGHRADGDTTYKDFEKGSNELLKAFPDMKFNLDDLIVEGDKFMARSTMTGTHKGIFMGVPATGKKVKIWWITIRRVANGKCVEGWDLFDSFTLQKQLGVAAG
jgi:predicted ester cyclase